MQPVTELDEHAERQDNMNRERSDPPGSMRVSRSSRSALSVGLALAFVVAACGGAATTPSPSAPPSSGSAPSASTPTAPPTSGPAAPTPATSGGSSGGAGGGGRSPAPAKTIAQPASPADLPIAPDSARIDLAMPTFSDPTNVTNPLFPISRQESVVLLGEVDGAAFRTEVTLLPGTRVVTWEGQAVETLVSQYVAYLDGQLHEVAYDLYAQDDGGSVWYFGEDVFNFADGFIADTHGTWLAGRDGPAAMIMPADPQVGDVYRPENVPGLVFEEVTVKTTDKSLDGPLGPIEGGMVASEMHMDGTTEEKIFAPGYGEFLTASGPDSEGLALAVPTDAAAGAVPADVAALGKAAMAALDAASTEDWPAASQAADGAATAWTKVSAEEVPSLFRPRLDEQVKALGAAVDARDAGAAQAAIDVARSSLDLQLRHRAPREVDTARFDLWARELAIDAAAGDVAAVRADFFSLDYVRDRIDPVLDEADRTTINATLEELLGAVNDEDLDLAAELADQLITMTPPS